MPSLIIDKNNKGYKILQFTSDMSIGRGLENDIIIEGTSISRNHAHIKQIDNEYVLFDSSSNGTFVNDTKISEFKLTHGAVFTIVGYHFTFFAEYDNENIVLKTDVLSKKTLHIHDTSLDDTTSMVFDKSLKQELEKKKVLSDQLKQYGVIVENDAMLSLYMDISELAAINVPVLITGEPGTGKEKVAEVLHAFSNMSGDLVPLNCAAIPEGIFESELFGSIKGAFSNATDKPGKLELAQNGTIFLDEIGDMVLSIQPKLLRFLEDKKVTRLGDTKTQKINARVMAATNQDLETMISKKLFRDDLYQRIACIKLHVPPLRERKEDIFPLADFFLDIFSREYNLNKQRLSEKAKKIMLAHNWPGNVRELKNVLLRAAVRSQKNIIEPIHLKAASDKITTKAVPSDIGFSSLEEMEKNHITAAMGHSEGNKAQAAKLLGISRDTLYKKLRKYEIKN